MTTPPRQLTDRRHWKAVAERNGIKYGTFIDRIRRGWSMEEAATKPLPTPEETRQRASKATDCTRVFHEDLVRKAEANGIPYPTFFHRVKYSGWDLERAATEPLWNRQQMGRLGAQRLREREGDWAAQIFRK